jgi:hypothetical protein
LKKKVGIYSPSQNIAIVGARADYPAPQ